MKRYECKLSPETLKKAIDELNEPEDNTERLAAIDKLRARFQKENDGSELIRSDDAFLLRFLRVRKFNEDRALTTLVNYHKHRTEWKELYDLVDNPKDCERLMSAGPLLPLNDARAKDGTFVFVGRPGLGFVEGDDMFKFLAIILLSVEKQLEKEEFQIYGVTIIDDMSNMGLQTAMQLASYAKRFSSIMREAMPVRIKSFNFINEALVFDILWTVISTFMGEKLKNRLTVHGSNVKTLHDKVDPVHLPFFLGGSGPDLNADWWTKEVLSTVGSGEDTSL
ncbi:alpha-tocopherol transfer protein-like [Styela clava]